MAFKPQTSKRTKERQGKEARRTPRRVYARPIGVLMKGSYSVVQALQLSEGGLLFQSDEERFLTKAQVVVSLVLPGGGAVVARGEIIYDKPESGKSKQFGVRFAPLPLHLRRWIRNYVTAKTQAEAEMEMDDSLN